MTRATTKLLRLHQLRTQLADVAARERALVDHRLMETERTAAAMHHHMRSWNVDRAHAKDAWRAHRAASDVAHRAHAVLLQRAAELRSTAVELQVAEQAATIARDQAGELLSARKRVEKVEEERRSQKEIDDLFAAARVQARRATLL